MNRESGIYAIVNTTTNKQYIGSSVNLEKRFAQHLYHLRRNTHHSPRLQNSYNKHGEEMFSFVVLELCPNDRLKEIEQTYLDNVKPFEQDKGYNIANKSIGGRKEVLSIEDIPELRNLTNEGYSQKQISLILDVPTGTIADYQKRYQIKSLHRNPHSQYMTNEEYELVKQYTNEGLTQREIAKRMNRSQHTINKTQKKLGITSKHRYRGIKK